MLIVPHSVHESHMPKYLCLARFMCHSQDDKVSTFSKGIGASYTTT